MIGGELRGNGRPLPLGTIRKVAVVGSNPATCELAPFDSPYWDIWVLNEAPTTWEPPRIDAVFQIHKWESFARTDNSLKANHWDWLQEPHDFPIFMEEVLPQVPASVEYPLKEIIDFCGGRKFLTSSAAYALALAHYLGYDEVGVWGVHVASEWEYEFQREGIAYWLGRIDATAKLSLVKGCGLLSAPLYGYDGETMIDLHYLIRSREVLTRVAETEQEDMDRATGAVAVLLKQLEEAEGEEAQEQAERELQPMIVKEREHLIKAAGALARVQLCEKYITDLKAMMTAAGEYKATQEVELTR